MLWEREVGGDAEAIPFGGKQIWELVPKGEIILRGS